MHKGKKVLLSAAAIAFVIGTNIELVDTTDKRTGFSPAACTFIGPKRTAEEPTWAFFTAGTDDGMVRNTPDVARLAGLFEEIGYRLDEVREGERTVPRLMLASLPAGISSVPTVEEKKRMFLATVLPVALYVNEKLAEQRRILIGLEACRAKGKVPDAQTEAWLRAMAELYDTAPKISALLARVDTVPPSLMLAQAAAESGWGTSRFAQQGNALFGEYTWGEANGMRPGGVDGKARIRVRRFDDIVDSVVSYARNLNTHPAYAGFRDARARARAGGAQPDSLELAGEFVRYSIRREAYVEDLRAIIRANKLDDFDRARLDDAPRWVPAMERALLRS